MAADKEKDDAERLAHRYEFSPIATKVPFLQTPLLDHSKDMEGAITGEAWFQVEAVDPLHVGSGLYELSEEADFEKGYVVLGIARRNGVPIIPGSSLKGASRSLYEAITRSCVSKLSTRSREPISSDRKKSKIPQVFVEQLIRNRVKDGERVSVYLAPGEPKDAQPCGEIKRQSQLKQLCPACALYGGMGFLGRVWFSDAIPLEDRKPQAPRKKVSTESLNSPHLHRAGKIKVVKRDLVIEDINGRKVYYQSPEVKRGSEPMDYIPQGSILRFKVNFNNITREELGGIFASLALDGSFPFRVGGKKASGFGRVRISLVKAEWFSGADRYLGYDTPPQGENTSVAFVSQAIADFKRSAWFHHAGYEAIIRITKQRI